MEISVSAILRRCIDSRPAVLIAVFWFATPASFLAQTTHSQTLPPSSTVSQGSTDSQSIDLSSVTGQTWEFRPEGGEWRPIRVPEGGWKTQGFVTSEGAYRTQLHLPAYPPGSVVRMAFAAVNFGAAVLAGPDEDHLRKIAEHLNGWMPFYADLTAIARPGEKLMVEVEVRGRGAYLLPNGKFSIAEGASWFPGLADGILRAVELQVRPSVHIENIHVVTSRNPDTFHADVELANAGDKPQKVTLKGTLRSLTGGAVPYPRVVSITATVPAHSTSNLSFAPVPWPLGPGSYWWPNIPYRSGYRARLHELSVQLSSNSEIIDSARQRFGFREFKAVGNHYELNGVHVNLRGDNQQEADFGTDAYGIKPGFGKPTPSNGGWPETVDNLQRLNFNVLRITRSRPRPTCSMLPTRKASCSSGKVHCVAPNMGKTGQSDTKACWTWIARWF